MLGSAFSSAMVMEIAHVPLRATALLLLAFALAWLLRHRAAALRHRLWALALVALLLLPLPAALPLVTGLAPLPAVPLALLPAPPAPPPPPVPTGTVWQPATLPDQGQSIRHLTRSFRRPSRHVDNLRGQGLLPPPAPAPSDQSPIRLIVLGAWLAGAAVVLARNLRARRRARLLLRLSRPADPELWPGTVDIPARETDAIELPITVGALRPIILLPAAGRQWPPAWRRSAVAHERAHLRQRDPLLQALAELATALYWFHPLVWLAARQLRVERELAADDQVLLGGHRGSEYAELLVTLACAPEAPPVAGAVLPLLTPAGLKARLLGILDGRRRRLTRRTGSLLLGLAAALALVPIAAALPVRAPGPRPAPEASTLSDGRTGFVVGRAVDGESGRPLGGVEVDFLLSHRVLRVVTGDDGWIRSPLPGDRAPEDMFNLYARRGPLAARKTVLAVRHGTELPVDVALYPARTLRGRVRSSDGQPLPGVRLHLVDWQSHAVGPGGGALAVTAADGSFTVAGLLYGEFTLLAVAPSGASRTRRLIVPDADPPTLEVIIPAPGEVSGWLRDDAGRPLGGVRVDRVDGSNLYPRGNTGERHVDWDVTDDDGSFRMMPLGDVLYAAARDTHGERIEALFADGGSAYRIVGERVFKRTGDGSWRPGVVLLQRPAVLDVRVEDPDGRPVPMARLQIAPTNSERLWSFWGRALSGPDGRLPAVAVPPGSMTIEAIPRAGSRPAVRERISVRAGEHRQITVVARETGR